MALDFDQFPLYDPLVKKNTDYLSEIWKDYLSTFYGTLTSYITQNGIIPPSLTTAQRDQIISPRNGQTIYNTTLNSNQYFKNGTWTSY
jgi:hypothetical protein